MIYIIPLILKIFFHFRLLLTSHALNASYLQFCPSSDSGTEPSGLNKQLCDFGHAHSLMVFWLSVPMHN